MSAVSLREKRLVIITLLVILYAVVGFTARKRLDDWRILRQETTDAKENLRLRRLLIANVDDWAQRYRGVRTLMPVFAANARVDTHWRRILDEAAASSGITIGSIRVVSEEPVGDVWEMTIECRDWKGTLENLVNFLYKLHLAGAMLDIRTLYIRPDSKNPENLSGQFTLSCAFMRETPPAN